MGEKNNSTNKNKRKRGRKPGNVKNPKEIRKHFLISKVLDKKLAYITAKGGEYEAIYLRQALYDYVENYEKTHGKIPD